PVSDTRRKVFVFADCLCLRADLLYRNDFDPQFQSRPDADDSCAGFLFVESLSNEYDLARGRKALANHRCCSSLVDFAEPAAHPKRPGQFAGRAHLSQRPAGIARIFSEWKTV